MNQRACHYFSSRRQMAEYCSSETGKKDFLELTNKFRTCIYIADENRPGPDDGYDAVLSTYEAFTQYLTYEDDPVLGEPRLIGAVRVHDVPQSYWIQDIDVWVGFPAGFTERLKTYSIHFFFYDTIDFVHRIK